MGTAAFPTADVCYATVDFADSLDHLAIVLWQDLAVLWPRMKKHRVFTISPFCDNEHGWFTFRDRALRLLKSAPPPKLQRELEQARLRNDHTTAKVLAAAIETYRAPTGQHDLHDGSPIRLIRETHRAIMADPISLRTTSSAHLFSLRTAQGTEAAAAAASAAAAAAVVAGIVPSDPATWPCVLGAEDPPPFATSFEFTPATTVAAIVNEWKVGTRRQDGSCGPPVKELEARYGPTVRTGKSSSGSSYRSKKYRGNQAVDNKFAKRKRVYDIIEAEGADGATRLQGLIEAQFGAESPPDEAQVRWLLDSLKEQDPRHAELAARAQTGALKRRKIASAPVAGAPVVGGIV